MRNYGEKCRAATETNFSDDAAGTATRLASSHKPATQRLPIVKRAPEHCAGFWQNQPRCMIL